MLKPWLVILATVSFLLAGCLKFGNNYSSTDGQPLPKEQITQWLGAPLPNHYSGLKYEIVSDTPDPYAKIAVKVPEEYYKAITQNLIEYEQVKDQLQYDIKPREWQENNIPSNFIKRPAPSTKIWLTKTGHYRKYIWYEDSVLYFVYLSS